MARAIDKRAMLDLIIEAKKTDPETGSIDVAPAAGGGGLTMERLTAKNKHGKPIIKDWPNYMEFDIINRLATIEDILGDEYDLDRLRELVQADREGRCVVLKFAPGSKVYRVWFNPSNGKLFITEHIMKSKEMCLEAELWNDAYKTKEEAEKALEEMEETRNG